MIRTMRDAAPAAAQTSYDVPALVIGGIVTAILSLVVMVIMSNVLSIAKYRDRKFYIKGCGQDFLDSIRAQTMP